MANEILLSGTKVQLEKEHIQLLNKIKQITPRFQDLSVPQIAVIILDEFLDDKLGKQTKTQMGF